MIIYREITPHLRNLAKQFSSVAVMGPRQSGKTTLVKETFPDYAYVSLEDLDFRMAAKDDPRNFLATYENKKGVIIDEVQEVPELFSYLQGIIDKKFRPGFFILTGSQNFLMHEKITQTLAGRIAILTLLPFSIFELQKAKQMPSTLDNLLIKGFYPPLYSQPVEPRNWFKNYVVTYIEKDVRQVLKISDVVSFQRFLKLCAARTGNLLNYSELARDCDISPNTAKSWLSILESSYIIKLLYPYYKNFNKRIIKAPKLYFYDTGLTCFLLDIKNADELNIHPLRGHIFESMIISEFFKYNYNNGEIPSLFFWRDTQGHEIDCIIEKSLTNIIPVEIKSRMTVSNDFFKGLIDWREITKQEDVESYVVYAGKENLIRKQGNIYTWEDITKMMKKIYKNS
ncbi:TPA: AAA family ATPase [Candidatus Dependentiae bacterium]|nr:MAG: hypothetical protein US03_C0013G0017 [candidate division TM6 bacterium GW2011_GWF2_36_131]KKQ02560.1 MAG: hypothetical protein US13_C0014G0017 [candidate division TM6 bacterium GW2011_GWE2_36_25]KKQ19315.1 MAG: hypothetical protein US32_C0011G0017 [candidate division TM6 bacterium GW2011_GWA2_36_9]HBR70913.1 AAA family ATPase [Candidatus Dependentiae bacterium]HCU00439.1 AAA family ATPase [Candidatus Dependentiae bacterium]